MAHAISSFFQKEVYDHISFAEGIGLSVVATIGAAGLDIRKKWHADRSNYYLELSKHLTSKKPCNFSYSDIQYLFREFVED